MARVTVDEVREIITTTLSDARVTVFITVANLTVTEYLGGTALSADLLKEIERFLSAHYIILDDRRTQQQAVEGVSETVPFHLGYSFFNTHYGQAACDLDSTGTLRGVVNSKGKTPTFANQLDIYYAGGVTQGSDMEFSS